MVVNIWKILGDTWKTTSR